MSSPVEDNGSEALYKAIGKRLRYWRRDHLEIYQQELADVVGVQGNAISLWERGGGITLKNLLLLSEKVDISLDWLLHGESNKWNCAWFRMKQLSKVQEEFVLDHLLTLIEQLSKAEPQSEPQSVP